MMNEPFFYDLGSDKSLFDVDDLFCGLESS